MARRPTLSEALKQAGVPPHLLGMDGISRDATDATTAPVSTVAAVTAANVTQAAAGDRVAFARLVAAYHADMIRVAYVVSGGSQDIADDAVQTAWTVAWRKLSTVRDPERVKPWLVAVAANEARQLCRRQRMQRVGTIELDGPADVADPADPDPDLQAEVLDLEAALQHLAPAERTLFALRYEAGFDSAEIGRLIGRPAATVRWRLFRIVGRLRKELSDA